MKNFKMFNLSMLMLLFLFASQPAFSFQDDTTKTEVDSESESNTHSTVSETTEEVKETAVSKYVGWGAGILGFLALGWSIISGSGNKELIKELEENKELQNKEIVKLKQDLKTASDENKKFATSNAEYKSKVSNLSFKLDEREQQFATLAAQADDLKKLNEKYFNELADAKKQLGDWDQLRNEAIEDFKKLDQSFTNNIRIKNEAIQQMDKTTDAAKIAELEDAIKGYELSAARDRKVGETLIRYFDLDVQWELA